MKRGTIENVMLALYAHDYAKRGYLKDRWLPNASDTTDAVVARFSACIATKKALDSAVSAYTGRHATEFQRIASQKAETCDTL